MSKKILEALQREYLEAAHAMQSGVAASIAAFGVSDTTPKHLRVGVNSAMVDSAALAKLLIDRGIITELEYFTALRDGMLEEKRKYEERLSNHFGRPVTLG